jgi:hypothetical protein
MIAQPNKPIQTTPLRGPKIVGVLQARFMLTLVSV